MSGTLKQYRIVHSGVGIRRAISLQHDTQFLFD